MVKIDLKDRKILYQLDLNCRQSNNQIGKKVGLSKEVVNYRIKRMQENGIIKCFWTSINSLKLGYYAFRIYINFLDVNPEIKNKIINYFKDYKNVWTLQSAKGPVDLSAIIWADDIYNFNIFWNKTLDRYGNHFEKYAVSILTQVNCLKRSYLLKEGYDKSDRDYYTISCIGEPVKIDNLDYKLLNEIADNARIPLLKLAKKLNSSSQTINYRIKSLIKKGIILAFRVDIDISQLNLQNCMIDIYLKDHTKGNKIKEYLKVNPYVEYIMDMTIGWCDINFELLIKNFNSLTKIVDEIDKRFPGAIRKTNFWMARKVHKDRWLPELF
jgi:Lrp/AsnC family transcriptional regulator, leucine-responsive regulatory protein